MVFTSVAFMLLQYPFGAAFPEEWSAIMSQILNVLFALAIRGYLMFLLAGMIIYVTGLNDTLSKVFVGFGIVLYFGGPFIVNLLASFARINLVTMESATAAWLNLIGLTDAEIVYVLVWIGEVVAAVCCLAGAILYFTPSTKELKSRGQSLIVRSLLLAPILIFFHVTPLLL
jgi:hypothetical protein